MFSEEIINVVETIISLNDENQTRTPIAYRGSLFYVYSISANVLQLVPINATYSEYAQYWRENKLWFSPRANELLNVESNDVDIDYIIETIRKPQTQVAIKFAELEEDLLIHHMQIVLRNIETLDVDIEPSSIFKQYKTTGKFYKFDEDDESYQLID